MGDLAAVFDVDLLGQCGEHLHLEAAELFSQGKIGPEGL